MSIEREVTVYSNEGKVIDNFATKGMKMSDFLKEENIHQKVKDSYGFAIAISDNPYENEVIGTPTLQWAIEKFPDIKETDLRYINFNDEGELEIFCV